MFRLLARAEQCWRQRSGHSSKRSDGRPLGSLNPNKQKSMERFQFYFFNRTQKTLHVLHNGNF